MKHSPTRQRRKCLKILNITLLLNIGKKTYGQLMDLLKLPIEVSVCKIKNNNIYILPYGYAACDVQFASIYLQLSMNLQCFL